MNQAASTRETVVDTFFSRRMCDLEACIEIIYLHWEVLTSFLDRHPEIDPTRRHNLELGHEALRQLLIKTGERRHDPAEYVQALLCPFADCPFMASLEPQRIPFFEAFLQVAGFYHARASADPRGLEPEARFATRAEYLQFASGHPVRIS